VTAPSEPVRVLVADDNEAFLEATVRVVDGVSEFVLVGAVRSGEEAVEEADAAAPDMVLLDVRMAGIGGLEAARRIHARRPGVLVVLLTADSALADVVETDGVTVALDKRSLSRAAVAEQWRLHGRR
jgi:CheY-like chemotaxis protein